MWDKLIPITEIQGPITNVTVKFACAFGQYLSQDEVVINPKTGKKDKKLTTSQLRKFFGDVKRQQLQGYNKTEFILLKPKLAYAVGRSDKNSKIKDFYYVMADAIDKVTSKEEFDNFIKIFEAIVAYHKAYEDGKLPYQANHILSNNP